MVHTAASPFFPVLLHVHNHVYRQNGVGTGHEEGFFFPDLVMFLSSSFVTLPAIDGSHLIHVTLPRFQRHIAGDHHAIGRRRARSGKLIS